MSLLGRIPPGIRTAASRILPPRMASRLRGRVMRRYDLSLVVADRESAARRWFRRHALRLYYPASLVSRESAPRRWLSERVLGRRPTLYHFDIHITDHCNLNCKGCGHFSNLCKPNFLELDRFESDMQALAAKLRVEQIYLLGGEPLLHPQVADFVRAARASFPETRIYVVTNGVLVTRMEEAFWKAMADTRTILMCDAYPIGLPVQEIDRMASESGVAIEWTDERDLFFKVPLDLAGGQDGGDSYRRCSGINNCPMYKDGRLYPCAYASYIDVFSDRYGISGLQASETDSIDVRSAGSREIMRFMTRPIPFCCHCDFDSFEMFPWSRSERRIEEWTKCG